MCATLRSSGEIIRAIERNIRFAPAHRSFGGIKDYSGLAIDALHQTSTIGKSGIVFDEISCEGRDASDIPRRRLLFRR